MDEITFARALHARAPHTWVTVLLVAACVIAYGLQTAAAGFSFSMPTAQLRDFGANFAPLVQSGQPWRLVSSMFLHGNPAHILFNMMALWQLGQVAERLFGSFAFLLIYLAAGIIGSLASNWWSPAVVSVGASGAIFGLAGALLAYLFVCRGQMPMSVFNQMRGSMLAFIGYSLFAGVALPGIDNAAHVGGLIGGALCGGGFARSLNGPRTAWPWGRMALGTVLVVAVGLGLWRTAPQVGQMYLRQSALAADLRATAEADARLSQRLQQILGAYQDKKIAEGEAVTRLQGLTRDWEAELARLRASAANVSDIAPVIEYAQLRQQVAANLARALDTHEQRYVEAAGSAGQRADALAQRLSTPRGGGASAR
ncbi:MAG: rhomboid family intramembrane serine protease [Rhodocyclaceae bacterium]